MMLHYECHDFINFEKWTQPLKKKIFKRQWEAVDDVEEKKKCKYNKK